MNLYIARHAWAGEYGDPRWPDDSLRPLTPEGFERYTRVIQALAERGFEPELIATSPLVRCRQTSDIISAHTPRSPEIIELDELAPGAQLLPLLEFTQDQGVESICWCGHAPDVSELVALLLGMSAGAVRFPKGAITALRFDGPLEIGGAELAWHVSAKVLGV
jgi:phosphohistidine phosphatase